MHILTYFFAIILLNNCSSCIGNENFNRTADLVKKQCEEESAEILNGLKNSDNLTSSSRFERQVIPPSDLQDFPTPPPGANSYSIDSGPAGSNETNSTNSSSQSSSAKQLPALPHQTSSSSLVVKIGHIGAVGALPNDDKILSISRTQLFEEGILGPDLDFDITSVNGCGDSFEGVAVAAELYHKQGIRAFIGPYCSTELEAVAAMGSFWNIPNLFQKHQLYCQSYCQATRTLRMEKLAIVTNNGPIAFQRVQAFEEEFRKVGTSVVKKVMFEENWDAAEMIRSGLLSEISGSARIIVCIFSNTRELSREFMHATSKANMNNAEYAYVLPWLQSGIKDSSPWLGSSGEILQQVKDHYANAIIVDDVNGFDDSIIKGFVAQIEKFGLTVADIDVTNIFGYLHLYDSLKLFGIAARKALEASKNGSYVTNGHQIWNNMRRLSFEGSTGSVLMDELADRAPLFAAFFIAPNRDKVLKVVQMEPFRINNCDGMVNKTGCFDIKLNNLLTGFWPSQNGSMPVDEPTCAIFFSILFVLIYLLYRHCQTRALNKMPWRIFHDDLRLIDEDQAKSLLSLNSANTKMSNMSTTQKKHAILGVNTHATYHRYPQRRPVKFCREDLVLLNSIKLAVHDNINPFLGIAFNEKEEMLVLWKFCSRGTVQDVIYNKNMVLDEKFHAAFVRDITLGLEYLHMSPVGYHGSLTPWACVIDRNWSVRLTDFGLATPLERWEKDGSINISSLTSDDDKSQASQRTSVLYSAPEHLKNRASNRRKRMDQKWASQSQARRQAGDIYSFGMVMYEILFRALPFAIDTDAFVNNNDPAQKVKELSHSSAAIAIVDAAADGSRHIKPKIQDPSKVHADLSALLMDCWSENPEIRPSIRRVRLNTETALKCKGSLVDQMMRVMEQYANNLEKLVKERTTMLEEANVKADRLLNQLLPAYVANELKLGRPVPPKLFSGATVLFSDIVGFTRICSNSSPIEVVNMLNGVYTGFDEKIKQFNSYKVETIGDAYMVVSGVPEENGTMHVANIANIALAMRQFLLTFEIPHRRNERIKCRWGFHTGAVAAGVIGLSAPRYCLFGDTVNTSSRMESTGMAELIQLSSQAHNLLSSTYPEFMCSKRGEVEVKGKGLITTYWLDRRAMTSEPNLNSPA
uniref:Guanylate cyclase n=1 Tax=Ditylenchus dipsaci TaxID=166011 RepID=A0A915EDL4_9BILA